MVGKPLITSFTGGLPVHIAARILGHNSLDTTQSYMAVFRLYAGGRDLTDPYVSPLFGDFTKGFPPSLLTSGTRDMLLSDTVRMHRALLAAGVDAELHVWEAAAHAKFLGAAPEDADHARQIRSFVEKHWPCPAA